MKHHLLFDYFLHSDLAFEYCFWSSRAEKTIINQNSDHVNLDGLNIVHLYICHKSFCLWSSKYCKSLHDGKWTDLYWLLYRWCWSDFSALS